MSFTRVVPPLAPFVLHSSCPCFVALATKYSFRPAETSGTADTSRAAKPKCREVFVSPNGRSIDVSR